MMETRFSRETFGKLSKAFKHMEHLNQEPGSDNYLLDIGKIEADPNQPRKEFEEDALRDLAESIRLHGLIHPVIVNKTSDGKYRIISGERRFHAVRLLGKDKIEAIIRDVPAEDLCYVQMAENLIRKDLTVEEIAAFICGRLERGEKQAEIAYKLGFDRSLVSKYAKWNEFPDFLKDAVRQKKISSIQTAYPLLLAWEHDPVSTEEFVKSKEKISTYEAKRFDPHRASAQPVEEPNTLNNGFKEERGLKQTDGTLKNNSRNLPVDKQGSDNSDADIGRSRQNPPETTWRNPESEEDPSELTAMHSYKRSKTDDVRVLRHIKNPAIYAWARGRECELLYKVEVGNGNVLVIWDDGQRGLVPIGDIRLSQITESRP